MSSPSSAHLTAERDRLTAEHLAGAAAASDQVVRHDLIEQAVVLNLAVADSIAARYRDRGMQLDDLVQVARLSLVIAAHRFDPERGTTFLAYAVPVITGNLRKHFRDHGWSIRPSRRVQEAHLQIRAAVCDLTQALGREPVAAELADAVGIDTRTVEEAQNAAEGYRNLSIDHPLTDDESTLADTLGGADTGYAAAEARVLLSPLVSQLADRDRQVLRLRYVDGLTQREVGEEIGISQMQVSRILSRILQQLRTELVPAAAA